MHSASPRRSFGALFNLVDLVDQLEQEKAAGCTGRFAEKLLRYDLIAIDELTDLILRQRMRQPLLPRDDPGMLRSGAQ